MARIPYVDVNILDFQLGIVLPLAEGESVKMGVSSLGTINTIYSANKPQSAKDQLGVGPLVEASAYHINTSKRTTYMMPLNASVAGTNGAITKSNGSGPTVTVAGAPRDAYQFIIKFTKTGILGTAVFQFSQDNGDVFTGDITLPSGGSYLLGTTNVTATFPAGTYTLGDTYSWTATAPYYSLTDLANGMTPLLADKSKQWEFVHVVGSPATVAAAASLMAALDTHMSTAEGQYRFVHAIHEVPDDTDTNILAAFTTTSKRVSPCAGSCELVSPIGSNIYQRNSSWPYAARLSSIEISEDAAWVGRGPLTGVTKLYRDENATPALDAAGFVTLRTWDGAAGFFVSNPRIMAPLGSDFWLAQYRRIMDRACAVDRNAMLKYSSAKIKVDAKTGFILAYIADAIDDDCGGQLKSSLVRPGHATSATSLIARDQNLLSVPTLITEVRVVPPTYPKGITINIGFRNPALSA